MPSLSATALAVHHHLKCDLYLYNSYHSTGQAHSKASRSHKQVANELVKAQFQRGNEWEKTLFKWLDDEGLLLRVHSSGALESSEIQDMIDFDDRQHFFIAGLFFKPPNDAFKEKFMVNGFEPVEFSIAKPDLVEVKRINGVAHWQVIDAKASKDVKASHHVQIFFYHLCLEQMLSHSKWYTPMGKASVWISPPSSLGSSTPNMPSFESLISITTSLLSLTLMDFFFKKLPTVLQQPRKDVSWHYNPLCHGCPFESDCSNRAVRDGELGSMPNIAIQDAEILKCILDLTRSTRSQTRSLPDIEELDRVVSSNDIQNLQSTHPGLAKRARRILHLPERKYSRSIASSPILDATLEKEVKIIDKRNFTFPRHEDIAVLISLVLDPSTNNIAYFCISVVSRVNRFIAARPLFGSSVSELVGALSSTLTSILDINEVFPSYPSPTTQFYVYSLAERAALQRCLIQAALADDTLRDEFGANVRLCIGALCEGAAVLATTFQPLILSGALLDFLGKKGKRSRAELRGCLERLGLRYDEESESSEAMRQRIMLEVQRVQAEGGRFIEAADGEDTQRRAEIGQLPRVVVVEREARNLLAIPTPGYWDLACCYSTLTSGKQDSISCASDESIFTAYKANDSIELSKLLRNRNTAVYSVVCEIRKRCAKVAKEELLVNSARTLTSNFMDICHQDHLRKLFFMQQFEVLTRLNELWQARIAGSPDAAILQYKYTHRRAAGDYMHYFALVSGSIDMPSDKDRSFFNYIMAEDSDDNNIPLEALFHDLAVYNLVFPLNKHTMCCWENQPRRVRDGLFVVDVTDLRIEGNATLIVAKTFGDFNLKLKPQCFYRLSPRFVDFNLTKMLSSLVELDLRTPAHPGYMGMPPFLQLCTEPRGFAHQAISNQSTEPVLLSTKEKDIHRALSELKGLGVEAATSLLLKDSQRRALKRILFHRLTIIWGPPGTGKTYTLSLSLLRLLEVRSRCNITGRQIIFVAAMTHAAIGACILKLKQLMQKYREIQGWPHEWLDLVCLEHVTNGTTHHLPKAKLNYIYAGTVYQLYNLSKRLNDEVDIVVIDEAGQLGLGPAALALRSLKSDGSVIIAGDSEQLAPILASQYPQLETRLFGSILDCLMYKSTNVREDEAGTEVVTEDDFDTANASLHSHVSTIVQLTENFRLNRDLGEFIQTIYSKGFEPQKQHTRQVAEILEKVRTVRKDCTDPISCEAQTILEALSSAMLRRRQERFVKPKLSRDVRGSINFALPRLISLALICLSAKSIHPAQHSYETHIRGEALFAASLVKLIQGAAPAERIFVATPHRIQRHAVREALRSREDNLSEAFSALQLGDEDRDHSMPSGASNVTVDTIERLQGSEAAFVICLFSSTYHSGMSSTTLDFLLERRRLNVAISRARSLCILITSREVLKPPVSVLTNSQSAKGFAFLKAFEERAWTTDMNVDLDNLP